MSQILQRYVELIDGLHNHWSPHPGQIRVGKALFRDNCKEVFVQAGRNWGKTELMAYCLWRFAQSNPGSENYYFSPYQRQSREILWASQRLQNFGPQEWIEGKPNDTEMRLRFANGSFIKVDGSDNVESYRGVKPRGISVFDEFKDFRPEFFEAYDPNRAAHDSPLLIIGTPPDRECQFLKVAADFKTNPSKKFFKAPTAENPHISRDWLEKKKHELITRGEEDVWQREYMAEFVPGGISKIFPMISSTIVKPRDAVLKELYRDRRKLEWYVVADPAAASVFAVLFLALNPYTKKWYAIDEIYETEQARMSTRVIGRTIETVKQGIYPDATDWTQVYDEAETWWANEMLDAFQSHWGPTQKAAHDKLGGLSVIKDILNANLLTISDTCTKLFWEMDNYYKDRNGKIPKANDHLIDTFRYAIHAAHYSLNEETEYLEHKDENFRGAKIEDDFPELRDIDFL